MRFILKTIFLLLTAFTALSTYAQTARELTEQGIQLNNAKNYSAAIEKYTAALALEPGNITAKYQMAFSLNAMGKGAEALPYFQEVVKADPSAAVLQSSYTIMAAIYDRLGQAQNAINNYKAAIKLDSADYALHYGLGLAYFRNKQYPQAEQSAIAAYKADALQTASLRLYGLVTFHQNKRAAAILSLCRFLYLDPKGNRSEEAYSNILRIIQGGTLKAEPGVKTQQPGADDIALNQAITKAIAEETQRRYLAPTHKFTSQLQAIFAAVGPIAQKQAGSKFFRTQLAAFFYKLSQSEHMGAFAQYIGQHNDKKSSEWVAAHAQQVEAMRKWVADNQKQTF